MLDKILNILRKLIPKPIFEALAPVYHFKLALLANIIYGFPGRKIKVIGVTGTNGKTTTSLLIYEILKKANKKVGISSTVLLSDGIKEEKNLIDQTMAGRFSSIKLLSKMVKNGCEYAILEVPSHALSQFRIWGTAVDVAVFTNITHDHLDYHKTFQNYLKAKGKLFEMLNSKYKGIPKSSVINLDDENAEFFGKFKTDKKIFYTFLPQSSTSKEFEINNGVVVEKSIKGQKIVCLLNDQESKVETKLLGLFNAYNILAAISVANAIGIANKIIVEAIREFESPAGRVNIIDLKNGAKAIIDYAHTPDALENLYKTLKELCSGKMIGVYGATGNRDKTKRPILGKIGGKYLDVVVVTDEEPGTEEPGQIINEIIPGILETGKKENENFFVIEDRKKAIKLALGKAEKNDFVIITGIGHQKFRNVGGKQEPWDEEKVINDFLN